MFTLYKSAVGRIDPKEYLLENKKISTALCEQEFMMARILIKEISKHQALDFCL